jgi:hypothetical protein
MPITMADFAKYGPTVIPKYVDNNISKRLKTSEHKFILRRGDKLTQPYSESKQVEDMGAASEMDTEFSDQNELTQEEGWPKRRGVRFIGAYIEYTQAAIRLGGEKFIKMAKEGLSDAPRKWLEALASLYFEFSDTARTGVPMIGTKIIVDPQCGDGLPIASTDHTFSSSSTVFFDTKFGSYREPDQDSIQASITAQELWRSNTDNIDVEVNEIQFGSTLRFQIAEILKSTDRSDTANRATNVLKGQLKMTCLKRMINQLEWRTLNNIKNDLTIEYAWDAETKMEYIPGSGGKYRHWLNMALAHGCNDPRGSGYWSKY